MATAWIKEFTGGLDTRRLAETTPGGALIRADNVHINRGGEVEKRAAFVSAYTLPSGTTGLAATAAGLVVFGSAAAPTMPAGVTYQRLQHSDGATALSRIASTSLFGGKIYAATEFADGTRFHFYDGTRVADWFDGRSRALLTVTGGGSGAVTSILIGGVEVLGATVNWDTDAAGTAADIVTQINTYTSSPNYTATAAGATIAISAPTAGTTANGLAVVVTASTITFESLTTTMSGGSDGSGFTPGLFVKTHKKKMYAVSGPNAHFSGIAQPTAWQTSATGAGAVDMSTEAEQAEALVSIATYQQYLAFFAERSVQIWFVDPDPALNRQVQVLSNTGTEFPLSVTNFGDNDVFYADESGLRSLRARDSSNAAFSSDIGNPVDTQLAADLAALNDVQKAKVTGLIEPRDGRFWLSVGSKIYVFSFFTGSKISAWTTYSLPYEIDNMVVYRRKVYIRAGNTIYVYGGFGSTLTYDDTVAEIWLPYLDGGDPTRRKQLFGIDASVRGAWEIRVGMDPNQLSASDKIAEVDRTSYHEMKHAAVGESTHISLRFKTTGATAATVSSAVLHYIGGSDED